MSTTITAAGVTTAEIDNNDDSANSGVSWGAIFAGAAAAAALSLILVVLGTGLGFAAMSPWATHTASAGSSMVAPIAWLVLTSVLASGLGGYLAGRLRVRWVNVHADEVYFRDTAHGLLAWAIASLVTAAFLASAVGSVIGSVTQGAAELGKGAMAAAPALTSGATPASWDGAADASPLAYASDLLFRADTVQPADTDAAHTRAEVARIFAADMRAGVMGPADVRYVGQLVARRTGLAPADAEARVASVFKQTSTDIVAAETKAKQVADDARRAAATASLWMFVSLLAGAFFASLFALYGGRRRDSFV